MCPDVLSPLCVGLNFEVTDSHLSISDSGKRNEQHKLSRLLCEVIKDELQTEDIINENEN